MVYILFWGKTRCKSDQTGIPQYAAGAMENWGLITYKEYLLFFDARRDNFMRRRSITSVIGHELIHQVTFFNIFFDSAIFWLKKWKSTFENNLFFKQEICFSKILIWIKRSVMKLRKKVKKNCSMFSDFSHKVDFTAYCVHGDHPAWELKFFLVVRKRSDLCLVGWNLYQRGFRFNRRVSRAPPSTIERPNSLPMGGRVHGRWDFSRTCRWLTPYKQAHGLVLKSN